MDLEVNPFDDGEEDIGMRLFSKPNKDNLPYEEWMEQFNRAKRDVDRAQKHLATLAREKTQLYKMLQKQNTSPYPDDVEKHPKYKEMENKLNTAKKMVRNLKEVRDALKSDYPRHYTKYTTKRPGSPTGPLAPLRKLMGT